MRVRWAQVAPYAAEVGRVLGRTGCFVDVASSEERLSWNVREGLALGYNYLVVVGPREAEKRTVNLRARGTGARCLRCHLRCGRPR